MSIFTVRARKWAASGTLTLLVVGVAAVASGACSEDAPVVPSVDGAVSEASIPDTSIPLVDAADASDATAERDPCAETSPPLCDKAAVWAAPVVVPLAGAFASISADELHVAYYEAQDAGPAALVVADRASTSEAFGAGRAFGFAVDTTGVSLSKDGLELLATFGGDARLASRVRPTDPFGVPGRPGFQFGGEDQLYRSPVMLEGGGFLLAWTTASVGQLAFTEIAKDGAVYRQVPVIPQAELLNTSPGGAEAPRPTGMSADGRTLFFYDEARKVAKAAFRPNRTCPFTTFVDLGDRPGVVPNASCTALYSRSPAGLVRTARMP